jgi:hypothetical protein
MSEIELRETDAARAWVGPLRRPVNSAREQRGSIHDDATAKPLGFRGGTVAGSIHMDQFVPVAERVFGDRWWTDGALSLYFVNATTHGEPVRVLASVLEDGANQVAVWMEREDGLRVAEGTASVGDHSHSELQTRDLRPGDPDGLRILAGLRAGASLGEHEVKLASDRQIGRLKAGEISEPRSVYGDGATFGAPVAAPSTAVDLLWRAPSASLAARTGKVVGLFGAIEVRHIQGPIRLDQTYRVSSEVLAVGESPKTEYFWFDSVARDDRDETIASMRMLLRFMKASSPLYQ